MAKSKKQTKEERLLKKRLAERKRYEMIKNNPDLWKEKQEKNRQSYLRRKQEKKQLPINEMTPRQQRLQRQTWRKNYRSYYLKKKREKRTAALLEENTPPQSPSILSDAEPAVLEHLARSLPASPFLNKSSESMMSGPSITLRSISQCNDFKTSTPSNTKSLYCSSSVTSAVRRIRYQKDKVINVLKKKLINLTRQNERYRKQLKRMAPKRVQNQIIKKKSIIANKKQNCNFEPLPNLLKQEVRVFYESDENSRLCSGKKEFIVRKKIRKQKRYLCDNLLNLHKKYLKSSNFTISYSTFCKLRPFWVLLPDSRSRDTCLCKLHTNMDLIIKGLYQRKIIPVMTSQNLLSMLCCDVYSVDCLHRNCLACKNKVVCYQEFDNSIEMTYWQWDTKQDVTKGKERKIRITEKVKKTEEPKKCIEKIESMLKEYLMHCGNIVSQYNAFKKLKESLRDGECIIHIDYSENYAVKSHQEIQSYHFGGSRKQLTLHTSVIYFLDAENMPQRQSFCTVSECLRHDISAVWAHIIPILEYISEIRAGIHTLHFISDSPSSQYRNKKIFHMISSLHVYLSSIDTITWNYSESGHGKGAPDGVGAVIKRTADRAVSQGQDIKDLDDFLTVMNQNLKKIKLKTISEYDVFEKDLLFPQNVKAFPGCMKMHQIVWNLNSPMMAVRKLSCTDKTCLYEVISCKHKKHLGFYHLEEVSQENITVTPLADSKRQLREITKSFWSVNNESNGNDSMTGIEDTVQTITNRICKTNNNLINLTQSANQNNKRKVDKLNERKDIERSGRIDSVEQNMLLAGSSNIDNISEINFSRDGDKDFTIDLENMNPYLMDDDEEFNIF